MAKKGDRELILDIENGEVVGFAGVKFYEYKIGSEILVSLHVRKDMRHKGIGRTIISSCAGLLYNLGIQSMYIGVMKSNNTAENLYSGYGAKETHDLWRENHKYYLWEDVTAIADLSVVPKKEYEYEDICAIVQNDYILFGTGEYCDAFMKQFPKNMPVKMYDNDTEKHGKYKEMCIIEAPEQTDLTVIIASCYYEEIEEQLQSLKCKNIVRFYPWHNYRKEKEEV